MRLTSDDLPTKDFISYWESLGFFQFADHVLPETFMVLFNIARILETEETSEDAMVAVTDITSDDRERMDREEEMMINRVDRPAPLSDRMEIETFKTIHDLKTALPRELAQDEDIFSMKLLTKSLMVRRFHETDEDHFQMIDPSLQGQHKRKQYEQKFYLLLDRSRSMEKKMRSFYSKCIVTEMLRRKMDSGARLYYRPFDIDPGELYRVQEDRDFPRLIKKILLTETGGRGTSIQRAIFQAVDDINFEKEMKHSEILVVTDGLSIIDREAVKKKLGTIRLNILKIGNEQSEPDWFAVEDMLRQENINIDPLKMEHDPTEERQKASGKVNQMEDVSIKELYKEKKSSRMVQHHLKKMDQDLRTVSHRFIEIKDLDTSQVYTLDSETEESIARSVDELQEESRRAADPESRKETYRKAYFLSQYISMLIKNSGESNDRLGKLLDILDEIRARLMEDPVVFQYVTELKHLKEDKNLVKISGKQARDFMKKTQLKSRKLTTRQMRMAKLMGGGDAESGNPGQLFIVLLVKLFYGLKSLVTLSFLKKNENTRPEQTATDTHR